MSLPPQLLNQVNKDLKAKLDRATSEVQRLKSAARLEQEVLSVTSQKLVDAKAQLTHIQSLNETTANNVKETERAANLEGRELSVLQQQLAMRQGFARDFLRKLENAEKLAAETKLKLATAEEASAMNEDAISKWIEENRGTNAATSQASQILAAGDARIKALRREVELLRIQTKQMDDATNAQDAETSEIRREIDQAIQSRLTQEREALGVRSQIADMLSREEEVRLRQEHDKRRVLEAEEALKQRRADLESARTELAVANGEGGRLLRAVGAMEAKKSNAAAALQRALAALEESEGGARLTEVEAGVLQTTIARKRRELATHRESLEKQQGKLAELERRREVLDAELKSIGASSNDAAEEEQRTARMLQHYALELKSLAAVEDRGRRLMQTEIERHQKDCSETDGVSQSLRLLRNTRKAQEDKHRVLLQRLTELGAVSDVVDAETEECKLRIATETSKRGDNNLQLRAARREEIERLKEELDEWERTVRHSKSAVEATKSILLQDNRRAEGVQVLTSEFMAEMEAVSSDIKRFHEELNALGIAKQAAAEVAEGTYWALEKQRAKAGALADGVVAQMTDMGALEAQGRAEEFRLAAEQESRKIELHSHEEDRRRMARRLQAAESQLHLLQSRYTDVMQAMQQKLDREALDKDIDPMFEDTSYARGSDKLGNVVALADPEEIEARHVLLRALERERLMVYGTSLDDQIVAIEKQSAALAKAIQMLRSSVQRDHALLLDAARSGGRLQSDPTAPDGVGPLVLLEGIGMDEDGLQELLADAGEERALLQSVWRSYESSVQERAQALTQEIVAWQAESTQGQRRLEVAQQHLNEQRQRLLTAQRERDTLLEAYRGLQRKLQVATKESAATLSVDAHHRLARTLLDKQRLVQATPLGQQRLKLREASDALARAVARLRHVTAHVSSVERGDGCYFAFRQLCDKYGVDVGDVGLDPNAVPVPRAHSSHGSTVRTVASMDAAVIATPQNTRRPATQAFVCAMREIRADQALSGQLQPQRHTTQFPPRSSGSAVPPGTLRSTPWNTYRPAATTASIRAKGSPATARSLSVAGVGAARKP